MRWKLKACFVFVCFALCYCVLSNAQEKATGSHEKKTVAISGTVTSSDTHLPLKNVQITITGSRAPSVEDVEEDGTNLFRPISVNSNDKGNFEFVGLPAGTYYIRAAHAGMILKGAHSAGILVNVAAGESQSLNLVMLPSSTITGRILNEDGEPMQNVSVAAMHYVYTPAGRRLVEAKRAMSDDKGEYRLFGLKPGSYLLTADKSRGSFQEGNLDLAIGTQAASGHQNQKVYALTYYQNETSPEQATPIVLKPGDETQANFALARQPAHHIFGKVSGIVAPKPSDKPEDSRCFVVAAGSGSQVPVGMAVVGKDSSFDLGPLPPGKYKITAAQIASENGRFGSKQVIVDASDVTGVNISLNSAGTQIKGTIRADGKTTVEYSQLSVVLMSDANTNDESEPAQMAEAYMGGSGYGFAEVSKDGSFKADISTPSSGPYHAVLAARSSGLEDWFTSKVLVAGKDVLESGFKINAAENSPIEIVISDKGATVEGVALNREKNPFPNAQVIALPSDPKLRKRVELMQQTVADQQGHFKLRGIRPGEYIAFAVEDVQEQPFLEDSFLQQNAGQVQAVKLESGAKQKVELAVITAESQ
jgi:hypothetical protein